MNYQELIHLLSNLLSKPENEIVEFKEAKSNFDLEKLGNYFSALSNEANLANKDCGWLVFGIADKDHSVVGTSFKNSPESLNKLKKDIADNTINGITFTEIYPITYNDKRIIMFQIPPAPRGIPVSFKGHWYGRNGESLSPLNIAELERIRAQVANVDWSAVVIHGATIEDLDEEAILLARKNYKIKNPSKVRDIDNWDNKIFLNKAKITIKDKITRTAILLLGKEEAEHFINPADATIRWILKDSNGIERDGELFHIPFISAINKVYAKIRNTKYRYIQDGTLFPDEVLQYEPFAIREALNNCIAHQDYMKGGRINIIESDDCLTFTNLGEFIPGTIENVILTDAPEEHYRNKFLADAMVNLNMIETIGSGIRQIFMCQRQRFFPMPDYDFSNGKVKVTLIGKVLNIDYARILARNSGINLNDIILLDRVQKKLPIPDNVARYLKHNGLIEGRKPNYFIGQQIAEKSEQKADYTRNKGFDKQYYLDLILQCISQHGNINRKDADNLLWRKLPDWMSDKQKRIKINHLLTELRGGEKIINNGTDRNPIWKLVKS